jgi:hypothetical protein
VRWGYYIDKDGNVSFEPTAPKFYVTAPPELGDALSKWKKFLRDNSFYTGTFEKAYTEGESYIDSMKHVTINKNYK